MIHDLADFLGVGLRQRTAEHGEILAEYEDHPAIDGAVAGDDAIARRAGVGHAKVVAAMLDEHIPFFEAARIEQHFDALAGAELAALMLGVNPALPAAKTGSSAFLVQLVNNVMHEHFLLTDTGTSSGLTAPEAWGDQIPRLNLPDRGDESRHCGR